MDINTLNALRNPNLNRITFIGSMDWFPNEDAVLYFLESIWPKIKDEHPSAELYIVGRNPSLKIQRLTRQSRITVTGFVNSVQPYLQETAVFVVPLRIGSGMRIKILEALSQGIPTVTTSIGMEGIEAVNGRDLIVADNSDSFAQSVIQILKEPGISTQLSQNGIKLVREKYSNQIVNNLWETLISQEVVR